jgi:tetratricopeptide (TPR) repeat protein
MGGDMAKNTKKSTFEKNSKAVLETVLNPEAKARVRREMALTQGAQAPTVDVLPFPMGEEAKTASGSKKAKTTEGPAKTPAQKSPKSGEMSMAELEKSTIRFMEEVREAGEKYQEQADALVREMQAVRGGVQSMEQAVQEALSRSEANERQLQALTETSADLQRQMERVARILSEKPWEAVRDSVQEMMQGADERLKRLESFAAPGPSVPKAIAGPQATSTSKTASSVPDMPRKSAALLLDKAKAYWNGKRYSNPLAAIALLDEALALEPNNVEALNERGLAKADAGALGAALADFSRAIELAPSMAAAYHNRGLLYVKANAVEKACRDFQHAASLGDDRAWRMACKSGYCQGSFLKNLLRGVID